MYYVVTLKSNGKNTPEDVVVGHRDYLKDMVEKGKVIAAGRLENNDGLVMYDVDSEKEFNELLHLDPFVSGEYRDVESVIWNVTIGSLEK